MKEIEKNTPANMNEFPLSYTSEVFMVISSFVGIVIGLKHKNKFPAMKYLFIYPVVSFLQTIIKIITIKLSLKFELEIIIIGVSQNIFILFEFLLIFYFFGKVLMSNRYKLFLRVLGGIYFSCLLVFWIWMRGFEIIPNNIYTFQALIVLIPIFLYFMELFKNLPVPDLLNEPSFWVNTGLAFYFVCTSPLFLLKDFVFDTEGYISEIELYSINYVCYGILFLLISKAYLCRKIETPS